MVKHTVLLFLCLSLTMNLYGQGDCVISDVTVTPHTCENGMFFVDIDFDIVNPEGDVFGIVGNATNYGFFMYEDLPVTLGPLAGDGETEWQFIIYDLEEPNCQYTYTFGAYDCCTISDVVIDQITCTGMSTFRARVDLSHSNTDSIGFDVYSVTGALLGSFLYSALPVTIQNIPSFRIGTTHITICDLGSSNCCTVVEFPDPDCNKTDCEIYNLDVDTLGCDNGDFTVSLDFDYMLGGQSFTVTGNGNNYGTYPYSALPLTLGPLAGDGTTEYEFVVTGTGAGNHCNATYELGTVSCPPGCGFDEVVIETMECRNDSAYTMIIDFVPISPGAQGFSVYTQGIFLGSFDYADVPITIDSFPASGDFYDELELCDNADTSCCFIYEFEALLCEFCVINQITVTPSVCDSNDQFYVEFDFYYHNVSDQGFYIGGAGGTMGPFSYDSLPVILGPFNGDSLTYYEFLVYDAEPGNFCFDGAELGFIDCDCGFDSISVSTLECTGNGLYSLLLDFTTIEVTHDSFEVYAGDALVGAFRYADVPVIVPAFPNSGNPTDVITICDQNTPTCCASFMYESPYCFCGITNIVADTFPCDTATNTFDLYLDFQWDGTVTEFLISLGGDSVGIVHGANLPDTLFDLSTNIGTSILTICGIGHPDCCASVDIVNPCQGPCAVTGLTVEALPCDSITKTFGVVVDFDWIGDYEIFNVFMDGVFLDSVIGAQLPDTISGLTTEGDTTVFTVYAKDRPDCYASVEILLEECRVIPCDIFDLVAVPGACTSDSTFTLVIDFLYQGFTQDSVDMSTGGIYLGTFSLDSLPFVIDAFPWNGMDSMSLQVCQSGDMTCCETVSFVAPYCGCDITGITATPLGYCNPDSVTFPVVIDVDWLGDVSAFTAYADTQLLAVINATDLPDTVMAYPLPEGGLAEITICGNDDSTCCATQSFVPPICDLCEISILSIDTFLCTGGSTFNIWVEYETIGVDTTLQIWANDVYLGEYPQFHPLRVDNIPESDSPIVLRICSSVNANCCAEMEFQGMHCPDIPCSISDVTSVIAVDTFLDEFVVTLDFVYANVGPAFTVSGNGNQYGVFTYNTIPVTLPPIPCDASVNWQFVVQDILNTQCFATLDQGTVICEVGLFPGLTRTKRLDIFYGSKGPYFVVPDGATEFSLWTYDGRLLHEDDAVFANERVVLSQYITTPGFYFVQVKSAKEIYVGKVVDVGH